MRKYVFRTLAFAALFCILLTVSVFAEDAEITGNDVNFRSGPGTDYAIYDCLPKGTVVTVTDRSNGEWYGVTYGGHSGFISSAYLSVSSSPSEPAAVETPSAPASSGGTFNAMYVRLRSGPSTDHSILVINGESGYMYADYVTLGENVSVPTVEPEPVAPTPAPTPAPVQTDTSGGTPGHISGSYVYFRTGPDTTYAIYDSLDNGTKLTITGRSGNWIAVTIGGTSGYVYSSYVVSDGGDIPDLPSPTPEPTPEPTPAPVETTSIAGYITGNDVRFRSGPSTEYGILGVYNYGKALTITGSSGQWKAVTIDGTSGYVYGQYVAEGADRSSNMLSSMRAIRTSGAAPRPAALTALALRPMSTATSASRSTALPATRRGTAWRSTPARFSRATCSASIPARITSVTWVSISATTCSSTLRPTPPASSFPNSADTITPAALSHAASSDKASFLFRGPFWVRGFFMSFPFVGSLWQMCTICLDLFLSFFLFSCWIVKTQIKYWIYFCEML